MINNIVDEYTEKAHQYIAGAKGILYGNPDAQALIAITYAILALTEVLKKTIEE